ncbi:MAG: hypothetical protein Q8P31_03450 [Bacillota bacterium]|nr:hypothetical protein [Bacillota bacterium]
MSITERELLMLQDNLQLHATLAEKAAFFASQVNDPEIRQVLQQLQRGHERHVESVVQHINQASAGGMGVMGTQQVFPYATQSPQVF